MDVRYIDGYASRDALRNHIVGATGGFYPIGASNKWHTGVHVHRLSDGSKPDVKAIAAGKVIACRITEKELDAEEIFDVCYGKKFVKCDIDYGIVSRSSADMQNMIRKYFVFDQTADAFVCKKEKDIAKGGNDYQELRNFICSTSNNFVLIEHEIPGKNNRPILYYSLYMHLKAYGTLLKGQQDQLPSWYKTIASKDNELNTILVQNPPADAHVQADAVIGFKGDIPFQPGACHVEVFAADNRILDLFENIDPSTVDINKCGKYSVSGTVSSSVVHNRAKPNRSLVRTNQTNQIGYFSRMANEVGFKIAGESKVYWVLKSLIKINGYTELGKRINPSDDNNKIIHFSPLKWVGFTFAADPGSDGSINAKNGLCDINDLIQKIKLAGNDAFGEYDNYISTGEIRAAMNKEGVYYYFSKLIILCESEWDSSILDNKITREMMKQEHKPNTVRNQIKYLKSLQFVDKVSAFSGVKKFYYFHPWEFADNLRQVDLRPEFNPYAGTISRQWDGLWNNDAEKTAFMQNLSPTTPLSAAEQAAAALAAKSVTVTDNPGFAPEYEINPEYAEEVYAAISMQGRRYAVPTGLFGQKYMNTNNTAWYRHEGVDFRGSVDVPIISFIYAQVVACGWTMQLSYGRMVLLAKVNPRNNSQIETGMYLIAHLGRVADGLEPGSVVCPGETVGFVGRSGWDGSENEYRWPSSHLHVSYFNQQYDPNATYFNISTVTDHGIFYINEQYLRTLGAEHDPFNHGNSNRSIGDI